MCSFECAWQLRGRDFAAARAARVMFASLLKHLVTDDSDVGAAELVFGELVTNALRYGGNGVRVEVRHEDDGFHLVVCDRGEGFDPAALPQPSAGEEGGRGLHIVRRLTGDVRVERADGCRISTRMLLRCRAWAA